MKKLWINAGEFSGDVQGGALLRALRVHAPHLDVVGMGGETLAAAGQRNLFHSDQLSVMGIAEVLGSLPRIVRLLAAVKKALIAERPDALLLIDAPEFNFRVAAMADKLGIPVYYFIPPKVWAWRTGRIQFLQRHVRRIFSILPFEVDFYGSRDVAVTYVGNPLVDMVDYAHIRHIDPVPHRIGLMPGSRKKEVETLLPAFAQAAELLRADFPYLSFHCLAAPNFDDAYFCRFWRCSVPLVLTRPDNRYEFMRTCQCIMAASGTATLETALAGVPTLVAYKLNPLSYFLGRHLVNVPYISLPNLILGRQAFPEHIQHQADPARLAARLRHWLSTPEPFQRMQADMNEIRALCGPPGSAARAAHALWDSLQEQDAASPGL